MNRVLVPSIVERLELSARHPAMGFGRPLPLLFDVVGELDVSQVATVLGQLVGRHEILGTGFSLHSGVWMRDAVPPSVPVASRSVDSADELRTALTEELTRSTDPTAGRLLEATLLTAPGRCLLLLRIDHLVVDATSVDIILTDLSTSEGDGGPAPSFWDVTALRRQDCPREVLAYWREVFDRVGPIPSPLRPLGIRTGPDHFPLAAMESVAIRPSVTDLQSAAYRRRMTLFMLHTAALATALVRLGHPPGALGINTIISRRGQLSHEVVGPFHDEATLLVGRAANDLEQTGASVRESVIRMLSRCDVARATLLQNLRPDLYATLPMSPYVVFTWDPPTPLPFAPSIGDATLTQVPVARYFHYRERRHANLALSVGAEPDTGRHELYGLYGTTDFDGQAVRELLREWGAVLVEATT